VRSSDIAARCREIALRVDASGEWGELAETLREAAAEIERLRRAVKSWERESQAHAEEAERLRMRPEERDAVKKAIWEFDDAGGQVCQQTADTLQDMLKRLGGVI